MRPLIATRDIAAPASVAWRHLADVLAWPNWLPTVDAVECVLGDALAIGSRFRVVQPRLRPQVWTVTEIEPERGFTWEARNPGFLLRATHVIAPLSADTCSVELAFHFAGPIGTVVGLVFGNITRNYVAIEAQSLKALAESTPSRPE